MRKNSKVKIIDIKEVKEFHEVRCRIWLGADVEECLTFMRQKYALTPKEIFRWTNKNGNVTNVVLYVPVR